MAALALLEVLDRDGSVRLSHAVTQWPLRVGRSLDNDLVLDDPHTAPHHFTADADAEGVFISAGDTINGLHCGPVTLNAGQRQWVGDVPALLVAGRTHLRLRLPEHANAPELPLAHAQPHVRVGHLGLLIVLALLVVLVLAANAYLETDPDGFARELGKRAVSDIGIGLGWCGLWTLLSMIFTRQGHFGWHLRVLLGGTLAWQVIGTAADLLAFSLSWGWLSNFNFVIGYSVAGVMLYLHLLAVEPRRPRRMRSVAIASAVIGVVLSMWFNWQASERLGEELYMNHLFPPALRLAKPVDTTTFMQRLAPLQATLDAKSKKDSSGSDAETDDED